MLPLEALSKLTAYTQLTKACLTIQTTAPILTLSDEQLSNLFSEKNLHELITPLHGIEIECDPEES
jgi:hypothetical protein